MVGLLHPVLVLGEHTDKEHFDVSYGLLTLTLPSPYVGMDGYCSLKPLCSGMGEVAPARTSPTLLPHPLALCCYYPVSKCRSASIVLTGTVRVKSHIIYSHGALI